MAMQTLPDTFCIFILTHGRPDNVITAKTLKKCGYTGQLYFVVDDEDATLERYRQNFGADKVIVFDKKAEADACDEGNNFDERRTITMARNACFGIAEKLGVTHFVELDDDYTDFRFKTIETNGKMFWINNIDRIFCGMIKFYNASKCFSVALSQCGDFIGGLDNGCGLYRFSKRKCMNSFLCSTERPFRFIGAMNEDVNTYTTLGSRGYLFITIPVAALNQKQTQAQSGGISDMYKRFGTYCKAFTTTMMMPSAVRVSMMRSKTPRIHHAIDWGRCVPCIISEKYRKSATQLGKTPGKGEKHES